MTRGSKLNPKTCLQMRCMFWEELLLWPFHHLQTVNLKNGQWHPLAWPEDMGLCRIKETKPDDHHHKNKTVSIHISPGFALTHSPDWRASLRVRVCPFQDSEVEASLSCSARKLQWRETVDERDC